METDQELAAQVIEATRAEHESPAACDYYIATGGIGEGPFNSIYDLGGQVYILATEGFEGTSEEREDRAQALWDRLLPELQAYEQACRATPFAGWSNAAQARGDRIRYADDPPAYGPLPLDLDEAAMTDLVETTPEVD